MYVCMYTKKQQKHDKYPLAKKTVFFSVLFLLINNTGITCTLPHLIYINKEPLQIHKIHYLHVIMVIKEDWSYCNNLLKSILCVTFYLIELKDNRSNIVSSNCSKTKKSMLPCTTQNNTFIVVKQTRHYSCNSWVNGK